MKIQYVSRVAHFVFWSISMHNVEDFILSQNFLLLFRKRKKYNRGNGGTAC